MHDSGTTGTTIASQVGWHTGNLVGVEQVWSRAAAPMLPGTERWSLTVGRAARPVKPLTVYGSSIKSHVSDFLSDRYNVLRYNGETDNESG